MAITFINSSGAPETFSGGSNTLTWSHDITAGNCVVVCTRAANDLTNPPTIADSYGNTSYGTIISGSINDGLCIFATIASFGGTGGTITATFPSTAQFVAAISLQYSGVDNPPAQNGAFVNNSGGPTTLFNFYNNPSGEPSDGVWIGFGFNTSGSVMDTDTGDGWALKQAEGKFIGEDQFVLANTGVILNGSASGASNNFVMGITLLTPGATPSPFILMPQICL